MYLQKCTFTYMYMYCVDIYVAATKLSCLGTATDLFDVSICEPSYPIISHLVMLHICVNWKVCAHTKILGTCLLLRNIQQMCVHVCTCTCMCMTVCLCVLLHVHVGMHELCSSIIMLHI